MGFFSWISGSNNELDKSITVEQAQREYSKRLSTRSVSLGRNDVPIAISCLPAEYDDVPLDKMVGSCRVRTVGEYKDACDKLYGP